MLHKCISSIAYTMVNNSIFLKNNMEFGCGAFGGGGVIRVSVKQNLKSLKYKKTGF